METQKAYNIWAGNYDAVLNKTRDLEAQALRQTLSGINVGEVLEIGCGTGKNTEWLLTRVPSVIAVDFSEEMLQKAREKIGASHVRFTQADITQPWGFVQQPVDLVTCSLVLEHIQDLGFVFGQARLALKAGGRFYIGELHPFKQYQGSKARFDTEEGIVTPDCYVHHVADFFQAAKGAGFDCIDLQEWFDDNDRTTTPRLLSMVFRAQ
jgi:ubiquinone/menaquinone biosynthesis C-methylase UbiE